jgi:hypothetical protein
VGNYRIALGFLLQRDKLPYADDAEGLDVLLSKSQALLHVGREADAAAAGEAALAMIARNPQLTRYLLLALDWSAVANLAIGNFTRALALYDQELPLVERSHEPLVPRRLLVLHVSRAAAAVGAKQPARALADLDYVDQRLADAKLVETLTWPHATAEHVARAYRLIANGLRANASRELGRFDAEAKALIARRAILEERLDETDRTEIAREQLLVETQLALNASQRHELAAAREWLGRALARADDLRKRANGVSDREQLDVLWLAAQLTLRFGQQLVSDLPKRIDAAAAELRKRREPSLSSYVRWFEIYGVLLAPSAAAPSASAALH